MQEIGAAAIELAGAIGRAEARIARLLELDQDLLDGGRRHVRAHARADHEGAPITRRHGVAARPVRVGVFLA